jgi:hypothetical protein
MPEPIHPQPDKAVDGGLIYVAGGFVGNYSQLSTNHVWLYDTVADHGSPGPTCPTTVAVARSCGSGASCTSSAARSQRRRR